MTVAHVKVPTFLPFSETFIYQQMRALPEFEHAVLTVRRELAEQFVGYPVFALDGLGAARARLELGLRKLIGYCPSLLGALRKSGARVLHAHFGLGGYFALGLQAKSRLPMLTTFYGRDALVYPYLPGWRERYRRLFARGAYFVAISECARQEAIRAGCPPEKIETVYMDVDFSRFVPRPDPASRSRPDALRITFVGRVWDGKGVTNLVRAFAVVRSEHPKAELHYVGRGPDEERVRELASELGVDRGVTLHGARPPDRVAELMAASDVVTLPSVRMEDGWTESFGMVLVEAQACGVPVVGSRIGGIPETMAEGETGLLAAPDDPDDLARRLLELLADPDRRSRMGERASHWVRERFDQRRQSGRLGEIYRALGAGCDDTHRPLRLRTQRSAEEG